MIRDATSGLELFTALTYLCSLKEWKYRLSVSVNLQPATRS
jgi:hypothetical protein